MRARAAELTDAAVARAVAEGWGFAVRSCAHLGVGFGGHHWRVVDEWGRAWFVTVDDLAGRRANEDEPLDVVAGRLAGALGTARSLAEHGLGFVVAPVPATDATVLHRLDERWASSLSPWVDGRPGAWGDRRSGAERRAVLDLLVELHRTPPEVTPAVQVDEVEVQALDGLEAALADLEGPWTAGPLGERARRRLAAATLPLHRLLDRYDEQAEAVRARPGRFVLTHGEPHPGNVIVTDDGARLVDWDTVRLAPPERDLWLLLQGDGQDAALLAAYEASAGRAIDRGALASFQLRWDLSDVALFARQLHGPHQGGADDEAALVHLSGALDRLQAGDPGR